MTNHLVDLSDVKSYKVRLGFTQRYEPNSLSGDGLPFVSLEDEIEANSPSQKGQALRDEYGRIPYGSPIYLWEEESDGKTKVLYIGQTMLLTLQKRFEGHAAVMKLLADRVNTDGTKVYFRLCSVLDLMFERNGISARYAIEHFPLSQARTVVDDLEAYIIFKLQPPYNTHYKKKEKTYSIPFEIAFTQNIQIN
jgi:hypothetical protein